MNRQYTKDDLKIIRYVLDLSQAQLAEILGCSRVLITLIENGKRPISKRLNRKIDLEIVNYIDRDTLNIILDSGVKLPKGVGSK